MYISERQICILANSILVATKLLDKAADGTISREEFVNTMVLLESTFHGLNAEFHTFSTEKQAQRYDA
jgi:hypothetical protein